MRDIKNIGKVNELGVFKFNTTDEMGNLSTDIFNREVEQFQKDAKLEYKGIFDGGWGYTRIKNGDIDAFILTFNGDSWTITRNDWGVKREETFKPTSYENLLEILA